MSIQHLNDFPDRFSPMLVKELRQGMRAKTFVAVFLGLQAFLAVMMFSATVSSSNKAGDAVSGVIFIFFSIAVLVFQPLRGINALSSEVKGNTMEMMALTRLSAFKIVFGKWVAIVSQTLLLFSAIVPYLLLRYFFGGMDLMVEIVAMVLLLLTSMALSAATVGLSGCSSVIIRTLLPLITLPVLLWTGIAWVSFGRSGLGSMDFLTLQDSSARINVALFISGLFYMSWNALSLGTSMIAPAAENHSIWRRIVPLVLMLVMIPLSFSGRMESWEKQFLVFIIAVPAIILALTESAPLISSVREKFASKGAIGRCVGWLFYPCWTSGVIYALLLSTLAFLCLGVANYLDSNNSSYWLDRTSVWTFGMLGSLLFPAVWQALLFKGTGQRLANYLSILCGSYVMLFVLSIMSDAMNRTAYLWGFAWHPLAFIPLVENHRQSESLPRIVQMVNIGLIVAFLIVKVVINLVKQKENLGHATQQSGDE